MAEASARIPSPPSRRLDSRLIQPLASSPRLSKGFGFDRFNPRQLPRGFEGLGVLCVAILSFRGCEIVQKYNSPIIERANWFRNGAIVHQRANRRGVVLLVGTPLSTKFIDN